MVTRPGFPYLFAVLELWFAEGFAEGRCSSSFLQGHPPSLRFGHPDVTFGRHRPSSCSHQAGAQGSYTLRKRHQGTLSGALRSEARRERSAREGGFPCRSAGRCAPAASLGRGRGTRTSIDPPQNPTANHNSKTANKYGNSGRASIDDTPGIPVHW